MAGIARLREYAVLVTADSIWTKTTIRRTPAAIFPVQELTDFVATGSAVAAILWTELAPFNRKFANPVTTNRIFAESTIYRTPFTILGLTGTDPVTAVPEVTIGRTRPVDFQQRAYSIAANLGTLAAIILAQNAVLAVLAHIIATLGRTRSAAGSLLTGRSGRGTGRHPANLLFPCILWTAGDLIALVKDHQKPHVGQTRRLCTIPDTDRIGRIRASFHANLGIAA